MAAQAPNNAKVIAVFNHKGGVDKTTTTLSLGWKLAQQGKRVLLVDCDPQCNLTGFLVDPGSDLLPAALDFEDPVELFYTRHPLANIRAATAPLLGDDNLKRNLNIVGNEPGDVVFQLSQRNTFLPAGHAPFSHPPETLFLLGGHPEFTEFEPRIALATQNPDAYPQAANVPGLFHRLFNRLAVRHQLDVILLDLSPSASVTNKLFLTSSHYFVVPCSPDFFSHMAIGSLARLLTEWDDWMAQRPVPLNNEFWVPPPQKPIFLGHSIQIFTLSSQGDGQPAATFQSWIRKIARQVADKLLPALQRRGMALSAYRYGPGQENSTEIARIRNMQSVGPAATKCHIPGFEMTSGMRNKAILASSAAAEVVKDLSNVYSRFSRQIQLQTRQVPAAVANLQKHYRILQNHRFQNIHQLTVAQIGTVARQFAQFYDGWENLGRGEEEEEEADEEAGEDTMDEE